MGERDGCVGHSRVRIDNDDICGGCVFVLCHYIEWARLGAPYSFDVHYLLGFGPVYVCSIADGRAVDVTTVPSVAMAALRVYENVEDGADVWSVIEWVLWCCCILFHVFLDTGVWSARTFYWCLLTVICIMTTMSRHVSKLVTLCVLPFALVPLGLYTCLRYAQGYRSVDIGGEISKLYDDLTAAKPMEPLEISEEEDDFNARL